MSVEVRDGRVCYAEECDACSGTGLYVGMAERDGFAVVCSKCRGTGRVKCSALLFTGRKDRLDVRVERVLEVNPGICVGRVPGGGMDSFGGIGIEAWKAGRGFPRGSEMREHVCPAWWFQCANYRLKPEYPGCIHAGIFSKCIHFRTRAACWMQWDAEHPEGGRCCGGGFVARGETCRSCGNVMD